MKIRAAFIFGGVVASMILTASFIYSQEKSALPPPAKPETLTLGKTAVCEEVRDYAPYHAAVAFSISVGKISCFSLFDPVPKETFIFHQWFHRDKPSKKKRLTVKPPLWATFSTIQLRQTDKGPWRVEISDQNGNIFKTLRFSVTD